MAYSKIPISCTPQGSESFKVTLGSRNINIKLETRYSDVYDVWTAKVSDNNTGEVLIDSMPLVCGVNLLGQYGYLDIGEAYIIKSTDTSLMQPDNKTLGKEFILIWGDDS
jgi:hypothetical protein